jgi:DNA-binding MarR family transcriptional regulator
MSDNKNDYVTYLKFLSLSQQVREMPSFASIDPVEEHLLTMLASFWHQDKKITVVEAMTLSTKISKTTLHRRLTSLRSKGLIAHKVSEFDGRVKYVISTDLTQKYLGTLGRALATAQQG